MCALTERASPTLKREKIGQSRPIHRCHLCAARGGDNGRGLEVSHSRSGGVGFREELNSANGGGCGCRKTPVRRRQAEKKNLRFADPAPQEIRTVRPSMASIIATILAWASLRGNAWNQSSSRFVSVSVGQSMAFDILTPPRCGTRTGQLHVKRSLPGGEARFDPDDFDCRCFSSRRYGARPSPQRQLSAWKLHLALSEPVTEE